MEKQDLQWFFKHTKYTQMFFFIHRKLLFVDVLEIYCFLNSKLPTKIWQAVRKDFINFDPSLWMRTVNGSLSMSNFWWDFYIWEVVHQENMGCIYLSSLHAFKLYKCYHFRPKGYALHSEMPISYSIVSLNALCW